MKILIASCCASLVVSGASGSSYTVTCPAKFPNEHIRFAGAPAGWAPYAPSPLEATTADVMYGPPESYTYAVPDTYKEGKRRITATWKLAPGAEHQKWLQCGYGRAAELTLSQPLQAATTECTVTRTIDANGNVTRVAAVCKLKP